MDAAAAAWGNLLLALSLLGTAWAWLDRAAPRASAWALLLWLPVPFYAYSVAYGSVPIFLPSGGRTPGTTRATEWNCCRRWRWAWALRRSFALAAVREFKPRVDQATLHARCSSRSWR